MNRYTTTTYPLSGETLVSFTHESGLKVFLIPKESREAFALFGTKYGAMDHRFEVNSQTVDVPDGIAHFLEHKLFENEDGTDTFTRFAAHGASANAFTSNEMTAYLFSATEHIHSSLEVLLDFVTHPYFTPQTVQKEQGIIGQEIKMYEDDPDYQLYFGLLGCLFQTHPIKIDIAGTVESIGQITADTLYDCYHTFYHPQNMALVLCGPFEMDTVREICDRVLTIPAPLTLSRSTPAEPREIASKRITRHFEVAMGQFAIGLKEDEVGGGGETLLRRAAAQELALHLYFGRPSDFFNELYRKGVLSEVFSVGYQFLESCAFTILQGESDDIDAVEQAVRETLRRAKETPLSDEDFKRSQKAVYSASVQALNSPSDVATQFLSYHFLDCDLLKMPEMIASLTKEDITERISHWDEALLATSIILPKEKGATL